MQIAYQGKTSKYQRCAEIYFDDKKESKTIERMIKVLAIKGWNLDYSVEGYASCKIEDKLEYKRFKEDYLQVKKSVKLWDKHNI